MAAAEPKKKPSRSFNGASLNTPAGVGRAFRAMAVEIDRNEEVIAALVKALTGVKKEISALKKGALK